MTMKNTLPLPEDFAAFSEEFPADGTDLGRYKQLTEIGRGGMCRVYRAHDDTLGRDVAVKVMPKGVHPSPERFQRFRDEIRIMARLDIPGVVKVFDAGECNGFCYYVMELVNGKPLHEWAKAHQPDPEQKLNILVQVTRTLDRLHQADILHRDIKPGNILVTDASDVLLADFGIAKDLRPTDGADEIPSVTREGSRPGTPEYMSPETSSDLKDPLTAQKADIYCLGTVAFELLSGQLPFDVGELDDPYECMIIKREGQPTELRTLCSGINPAVSAGVMNALSRDPDKRPTAKTLLEIFQGSPDGNAAGGIHKGILLGGAALVMAGIATFAIAKGNSRAGDTQPPPALQTQPVPSAQNHVAPDPITMTPPKPPDGPDNTKPAWKNKIREGGAVPQLAVQWKDLKRDLKRNEQLKGQGALLIRLPQMHKLTTKSGTSEAQIDGTFTEFSTLYGKPGADCTLIITVDDEPVKKLRWVPVAGRADSLYWKSAGASE